MPSKASAGLTGVRAVEIAIPPVEDRAGLADPRAVDVVSCPSGVLPDDQVVGAVEGDAAHW